MANKAPTNDAGAAADLTASNEPRDTRVKTTRKQVRMQGPGKGMVIVSGEPNFLLPRSQAEALAAAGDVVIL